MNTQVRSPDAAAAVLDTAEALNKGCYCRTLDLDRLRQKLEGDVRLAGLLDSLKATRPHLFASSAVFLSTAIRDQMQAGISAIERIIQLPAYEALALLRAPEIARVASAPRGVFMSYDFHLGTQGPQLIEINTNAGGALLNAALAEAQQACCDAMNWAFASGQITRNLEQTFVDMFVREWRLQRGTGTPQSLLIVDDEPGLQYLAPEFDLFARLLERHGIPSQVADAKDLEWRDSRLWYRGQRVDMVYNRLTDFYLAEERHSALREAYRTGAVVLTPNPRVHALHADKRNLVTLSDDALLAEWSVPPEDRALLSRIVPRTLLVTGDNADALWNNRRSLFFKPASGYGAKAAYRGDKLTRRVWGQIQQAAYVAQKIVPPSERVVAVDGLPTDLKFDIRAYTYCGDVQLLAARIYAGQTTNFRTPGGGFAPVIVVP